jgi:putative aldouronate transport system substrate-binding protein
VFSGRYKGGDGPVYDSVNRDLYFCRWKIGGRVLRLSTTTAAPVSDRHLRADWLKNLNLEVPKNAEELRKVLLAFTTGDPDKNSKPDTYGWSLQGDLGFTGQVWGMLLGTPRLQVTKGAGLYIDISDKTIKSALQDAASMKTALQWFSDCYRDGSIDPQYVTLKQQDVESKFVSGQCGIWVRSNRRPANPS